MLSEQPITLAQCGVSENTSVQLQIVSHYFLLFSTVGSQVEIYCMSDSRPLYCTWVHVLPNEHVRGVATQAELSLLN